MILRLWRGWTTPEKADRYEELIATAILPALPQGRSRDSTGLSFSAARSKARSSS